MITDDYQIDVHRSQSNEVVDSDQTGGSRLRRNEASRLIRYNFLEFLRKVKTLTPVRTGRSMSNHSSFNIYEN
nr:hypothetical transcript [Hymenolepis microstoma]